MIERNLKLISIVVFVMFAGLFTGCNLNPFSNGSKDSVELPSASLMPAGSANLRFDVKLPAKANDVFRAQSTTATPTVTFTITVVNSGNATSTTFVVKKTVEVVNGVASVTFGALPAKPIIGEMTVTNGNIGGIADFHGAMDMIAGDNVLTVVPVGVGDVYDRIAILAKKVASERSLVQSASASALISHIKTVVEGLDFSDSSSVQNAFNAMIEKLNPQGLTSIVFDKVAKTFKGFSNGAEIWSVSLSNLVNATEFNNLGDLSGFVPTLIVRQGLSGSAYVYGEFADLKLGALIKINTANGARISGLAIRGSMHKFLETSGNNVLVGGYVTSLDGQAKECPFLLSWDTTQNATFYESNSNAFKYIKTFTIYKVASDAAKKPSVVQLANLGSQVMLGIKKADDSLVFKKFDPAIGPDTTTSGTTAAFTRTISGLAVDPYIEGTKFFFDANDNGKYDSGEPVSTPSDANGAFSLTGAVTDAHDIFTLPGDFGKHLGKNFPFHMRSGLKFADSSGKVIVSPLTSVVSWGIEISKLVEVVNQEFSKAGITDSLSLEDVKGDPLAGLDSINAASLKDSDLRKIRAVVAIQQYIATLKKLENGASGASYTYKLTETELTSEQNRNLLKGLAEIVKNGCNVEFIRNTSTAIEAAVTNAVNAGNAQLAPLAALGTSYQLTDSHKAIINDILQVKAIDVAKTCVSIADYCSGKIVAQAGTVNGIGSLNEAFFTGLASQTSNVMVKQLGPRYYFQRLSPALAQSSPPKTITGWNITNPISGATIDVDKILWEQIKSNMDLGNPSVSSIGSIKVTDVGGAWEGFKGIDIGSDGSLTPLK